MTHPTRPKLTPTAAKTLRAWLVTPTGGAWRRDIAMAAARQTTDRILETLNGNALRLWSLAHDIDRWSTGPHQRGEDGGAYDLATMLYDLAITLDDTGLVGNKGPKSQKWRDFHAVKNTTPTPGGTYQPGEPAPTKCGCHICRYEQPHPGRR